MKDLYMFQLLEEKEVHLKKISWGTLLKDS